MNQRKLCVYIACSLDGFIADKNAELDFLQMVEKEGEDYGYHQFIQGVDTVILGRKTYDWIINKIGTLSYPNIPIYVLSRTRNEIVNNIHFYNQDIKQLVFELKNIPGKNIYCDGGSEIITQMLKDALIDEMIISIVPVTLGSGIRLFQTEIPLQKWNLVSSNAFETGLVQLHYVKI